MKCLSNQSKASILDWYWSKGLHDAKIINKRISFFPDYYETSRGFYNCIEINVDSSYALFDRSIVSLKFYNCKEKDPELNIEGMYWVNDTVLEQWGRYTLKIEFFSSDRKKHLYEISFEKCIVVRQ